MASPSRRGRTAKERLSPTALGYGARAAGLVLVFGPLLGVTGGTTVDVVVGIGVVCFGRALLAEREGSPVFLALATMIITGSAWVAAARWSSTDLVDIRGAQAVLGATLAVGPPSAATGMGLAAGAAFLALVLWSEEPRRWWRRSLEGVVVPAEMVALSLFVVTLFAGPKPIVGGGATLGGAPALAVWSAGTFGIAAAAVAGGHLVGGRTVLSAALVGLAAAAAVAGGALIGIG